MNGPSSSSSVAAGAALWASSGGGDVVPTFAGASSASLKCADTARFADPEDFNADPDVERAADDDAAWAGASGDEGACAADDAWAVLSALRRICAALSSLKSTAGALES